LLLQDNHGLNINLLLWSLWCATRYETPPELVVRKAIDLTRRWSTDVTAKLRSVRRALKEPPAEASSVEAQELRARLKDDELMAEKIEQSMLESLAEGNLLRLTQAAGAAARARKTLASYVRMTGAAKSPGFSVSLLENLIELTFPVSESDGSCVG
jgi:uncharacterized protein (TIGR02444 family)